MLDNEGLDRAEAEIQKELERKRRKLEVIEEIREIEENISSVGNAAVNVQHSPHPHEVKIAIVAKTTALVEDMGRIVKLSPENADIDYREESDMFVVTTTIRLDYDRSRLSSLVGRAKDKLRQMDEKAGELFDKAVSKIGSSLIQG